MVDVGRASEGELGGPLTKDRLPVSDPAARAVIVSLTTPVSARGRPAPGRGGKGAPDDRATNGGEAGRCAACARVRAAWGQAWNAGCEEMAKTNCGRGELVAGRSRVEQTHFAADAASVVARLVLVQRACA